MKLTATELKELQVIDRVIAEGEKGETFTNEELAERLIPKIIATFEELEKLDPKKG